MNGVDAPEVLRRGARSGGLRGLWCNFLSPFALELAGTGGAAWLGVDLQHGALEVTDLPGLLRATDLPVLARSASHEPGHLGRILDSGVAGVIVPGVDSADQAAALVRAVRVPPAGARSTGPSRSGLLGLTAPLLLPMVETAAGLAAAREIARTPGVDGIFVGPYDLSLSLGEPAAVTAPMLAAIQGVLDIAAEAGVIGGLFAGNPELAARFGGAGLLGVDSDLSALRIGLRALFGSD